MNECWNKKAVEEKTIVTIDKEKGQENEKVILAFDSTSQIDTDHVCTIVGKIFLYLLK